MDISDTLVAKSDQLNADDLIGGPITVQITKVARDPGEQPVVVHISGGHRPWKPCKTMRRLLVAAWGPEASAWTGKWVTLARDPSVKWAGEEVGGIRVNALSNIPSGMKVSLSVSKGKKSEHRVAVLSPPTSGGAMELGDFRKWIGWALKNGWTVEQVRDLIGENAADVPANDRRGIVAALKAGPRVDDTPPDEAPPGDGLSDEEKAEIEAAERAGGAS